MTSHSPSQSSVGLGFVDRLAVIFDLGGPACPPVHLGDRVLNREHAVDRGLETPGDLAVTISAKRPLWRKIG